MENTKGLICPQCGSTDLLLITESLAKCKHCATNLQITKDKTEQQVTIIYQKKTRVV